MLDLPALLKALISVPGLSGHEEPARALLQQTWQPWVDELGTSPVGSLHALVRGSGPEPRQSIMFACHMDAVGLMVTGIEGEFLRLSPIGGIDPRILPGQLVVVHGRQELPGVIMLLPASCTQTGDKDGGVKFSQLRVDTGLMAGEVSKLVRPGDLVSFAQTPIDLQDGYLAGHSLDNRVSLAALSICLDLLQAKKPVWDVWVVATVQEELEYCGAYTSTFGLQPTLGVAVDATYGYGSEGQSHGTFALGGGITLGWGPNIHPGMYRAFEQLAQKLEMQYVMEAMPKHSGTDAYGLQVTTQGIPTMVLSIPVRYMHTPVEMVALADIECAGRLLAEFAVNLDHEFMAKLVWDE